MSSGYESHASGSTPPTSLSENDSATEKPPSIRTEKPLRVACVQYDIKLRQPQRNLRNIKHLTKDIQPGSLDLLVLPEMCLSGYIFTSAEQMMPFLEDQIGGPTYELAIDLAKKIQCYVVAGYPEKYKPEEATQSAEVPNWPDGGGVGYTSALLVDPNGQVIGNYRKTSLFVLDKCWAREGSGFMYFDLPSPIGRLGMAMCMDLNPKNFDAPWEDYEVGMFAYEKNVDTLVVPMNWPDTHTTGGVQQEHDPALPDEATLKYWAARLRLLHHPKAPDLRPPKEVVFITCNNVGKQEGILFVGTSCVMKLSPYPPHIEVIDSLTLAEEIVMIASVD